MGHELTIVQTIGASLEQNGHNVSFTALRREAEIYIEHHWKRKPKNTSNAWHKFKDHETMPLIIVVEGAEYELKPRTSTL